MLECYESRQKPLVVYSAPKSPLAAGRGDFVFKSHGEMKPSVGLARLESGEMSAEGREPSIPSNFFHWRLLHVNPDCRFETIGESIPVSEAATKRSEKYFIIHNGFGEKPELLAAMVVCDFCLPTKLSSANH